jgi:hypothetical protein
MRPRIVYCRRRLWIVGLIAVLSAVAFAQMEPSATSFMLVMNESMDGMDKGMKSAPMNGDVDHDFATMMMPHHQGAIDMAKAELLYGKDPVMRRLAKGIIVDQQSEIQAMQLWLSKRPNAIPAENKICRKIKFVRTNAPLTRDSEWRIEERQGRRSMTNVFRNCGASFGHLVARIDRLAARSGGCRRAGPFLTPDSYRAIQSEPRSPSPHPEAAAQSDELGRL